MAGSAVRPRLISQTSLPAVEHDAPTKPSQPPSTAAASKQQAKVDTAADDEAATAAAEHTAMLNRFRAEWSITRKDPLPLRLYKYVCKELPPGRFACGSVLSLHAGSSAANCADMA